MAKRTKDMSLRISDVSATHCHISPHYPACDSSCWLKGVQVVSRSDELGRESPKATGLAMVPSNIYQALQEGEIRILILHPGGGD